MNEQLALRRVIRHKAELGERELLLLGEVVQQRAGEEQAAIHGVRVLRRQKIGKAQHVERVHQKAGQKAVVNALGGGNGAERCLVAAQHFLAHGTVVCVLNGRNECLDLVIAGLAVDGRDAHELRDVDAVIVFGEAQLVDCELGHAAVVRYAPTHLEHLAYVALADGAAVVPDLCFNRAARVGEHCAQKRLAAGCHLGKGGLEQIKAFHVHTALHLRDGKTNFHDKNLFLPARSGRIFLLS